MMIGVAQVMGMKPTLRLFFSGAPACAKASVAAPTGNRLPNAAASVPAPTPRSSARRCTGFGAMARNNARSTKPV